MKATTAMFLMLGTFVFGHYIGSQTTLTIMRNHLESTVVTSAASGKPFVYINGRPVIVEKTIRQDGSTAYRARKVAL